MCNLLSFFGEDHGFSFSLGFSDNFDSMSSQQFVFLNTQISQITAVTLID
jgi:hypothetical protein